jgi:hypothetical protein
MGRKTCEPDSLPINSAQVLGSNLLVSDAGTPAGGHADRSTVLLVGLIGKPDKGTLGRQSLTRPSILKENAVRVNYHRRTLRLGGETA